MIFNIMMLALYQDPDNINENSKIAFFALRVLDPVLEVMVFLILFFGLNTIIRKMRHSPWVLFDKLEEHDE
jgi:multisubunit Na+/H+ antiporter MnhB subunit